MTEAAVTVHLALNWVMAGGLAAFVLGLFLGYISGTLIDTSRWARLLGAAAVVLVLSGTAAFLIGAGVAL